MTQGNPRKGATRLKLEEAEFFLGQLKPNYGKNKKFDFFLSAFFGAARSVLWMMRAEYSAVEGWEEWYAARQPDADEGRLFARTKDVRNRSAKSDPLKTLREMTFSMDHSDKPKDIEAQELLKRAMQEKLPISIKSIRGASGSYAIEFVIEDRRVSVSPREIGIDRWLPEFPGEHILTVCRDYYQTLAKIVQECEAKFG